MYYINILLAVLLKMCLQTASSLVLCVELYSTVYLYLHAITDMHITLCKETKVIRGDYEHFHDKLLWHIHCLIRITQNYGIPKLRAKIKP